MERYRNEQRILIVNFHLDGFVNRQNCRTWGEENPRVIHEKRMHPQRVTVWYVSWASGIFYENEAGQAQTVNGVRYREMITSFFLPRIEEMSYSQINNSIAASVI